jgi:hypothetical protein
MHLNCTLLDVPHLRSHIDRGAHFLTLVRILVHGHALAVGNPNLQMSLPVRSEDDFLNTLRPRDISFIVVDAWHCFPPSKKLMIFFTVSILEYRVLYVYNGYNGMQLSLTI